MYDIYFQNILSRYHLITKPASGIVYNRPQNTNMYNRTDIAAKTILYFRGNELYIREITLYNTDIVDLKGLLETFYFRKNIFHNFGSRKSISFQVYCFYRISNIYVKVFR